jgi:hypothetical protein
MPLTQLRCDSAIGDSRQSRGKLASDDIPTEPRAATEQPNAHSQLKKEGTRWLYEGSGRLIRLKISVASSNRPFQFCSAPWPHVKRESRFDSALLWGSLHERV